MSKDNSSDEDFWDKIFDKSKATKLPDKFPGDAVSTQSQSLKLEDVNEVVTDELDENAYSEIQAEAATVKQTVQNGPKETIKTPSSSNYPHSKCTCQTSQNGTSFDFKRPREILIKSTVDEKSLEERQPQSISKYEDEDWAEEDNKKNQHKSISMDPVESLEGVDGFGYSHVIESETVAELEEIFSKEKPKVGLDSETKSRDITLEEAKNLRFLLFGTSTSTFDEAWTKQNIRLNKQTHHALRYHKGQTEGVMSCIQAYMLKHILFDDTTNGISGSSQSTLHYKKCIISAIVDILWQAGMEEKATICLPTCSKDLFYSIELKLDGLIEKLQCFDFVSKEGLKSFIQRHFHFFEDDGRPGCIILIYSLILSRSIERVSEDMEGPYECLITQGTCSQALLNLLLVGKATPNVFNMSKEIKKQNGKMEMHYGISKRSEIGFLSFEEAENPKSLTVGSMLKTPVFPIWIVSLKNHTCVLFNKKRNLLGDWKLERRFELFYIGGIPRNTALAIDVVRLTIDTVRPFDPDDYDYEFNSELEDTIRTKWQDCIIDWNDSRRF